MNIGASMHLDHVAINVESIDRSVEWYVLKLNAIVDYQDETWAMLKIGDTSLALTVSKQHPPHIAFCVKDISELPEPLGKCGTHRDGSKYIYTRDPDGNVIEYIHWP